MSRPATTVHSVHFDDFSGHQFERLVFAYLLRSDQWRSLEWYGQSGGDSGRDIWGERDAGGAVCVQCVNRRTFPATKIIRDLDQIAGARKGVPDTFLVVGAGSVSATARDKVKERAAALGVRRCDIWSGPELEERLRRSDESLLRRFVEGVVFPDDPAQLRRFAEFKAVDDLAVVDRILQVFDRPAFQTPFRRESSLPAFRQAIGDTIQALNTGVWQTRDGTEIERLPSRHQLASPVLRDELAVVVRELTDLRARFEQLIREGEIRSCGCDKPDCSIFFFSSSAAKRMDVLREAILARVHGLRRKHEESTRPPAQTVSVVGSTNNGIIANQVTIRGDARRARAITLPGSIGADLAMYNYVEHLIKRLTEFRVAGASFGHRRGAPVHPGSTRKILEKQLGGLPKDLPATRFEEIVAHIQRKIDETALGRRNRKNGVPNYHAFKNHPGAGGEPPV